MRNKVKKCPSSCEGENVVLGMRNLSLEFTVGPAVLVADSLADEPQRRRRIHRAQDWSERAS